MTAQQYKEMDFCVFVLHKLARAWNVPVPQVYQTLAASGILADYIFPCYDTLHTMGAEALVEDLTTFARERGVAL